MSKLFNILLQIEDRSGARLNRLYSIKCHLSFPLTNAFQKIHSENYSRRSGQPDIFEFFTQRVKEIDGIEHIDIDCGKYDFKKLEDCRDLLVLCGNENGAMDHIIIEDQQDYARINLQIRTGQSVFHFGDFAESRLPSAARSPP